MADIQDVADRLAIRELIDRYTIGITRRDWDMVASCYHEDATWSASVGHAFAGRDGIREGLRKLVEGRGFLLQMTHGMTITALTADSAATISVLNEFGAQGGIFVLGLYHDTIRKVDGQWKFQERYFEAHYIDAADQPGTVLVDYAKLR